MSTLTDSDDAQRECCRDVAGTSAVTIARLTRELAEARARIAVLEARPERVVKAEALPLHTLDEIVEHLMADGTRDGLIHANTLNWTFGRSARRLAARIEDTLEAPRG